MYAGCLYIYILFILDIVYIIYYIHRYIVNNIIYYIHIYPNTFGNKVTFCSEDYINIFFFLRFQFRRGGEGNNSRYPRSYREYILHIQYIHTYVHVYIGNTVHSETHKCTFTSAHIYIYIYTVYAEFTDWMSNRF